LATLKVYFLLEGFVTSLFNDLSQNGYV